MLGTTSEVMRLFVVVLIVGNVLAFIAGLYLLVAPQRVAKWLGLKSAHPMSVRRLTKSIEVPRNSEKAMLRYPRVLGVALLAGGLFVLIKGSFFVATLSIAEGGRMLAHLFPGTSWSALTWETCWLAALFLILLGAVLAIAIGGLALMRVQTLKNLSKFTSRWVSTRQAVKPVSRPYYGIDRLIGERPQVWGGVITLLSIYTLVMIVWFGRGLLMY